jgi:DNA-binding NarL/FixJ family response regulator
MAGVSQLGGLRDEGRTIGCVVVADPDARQRTAMSRLLRRIGFDVIEATTGPEALEVVRSMRPVAVLLEVALPEICGYQVCKMLRDEYGPDLPILLLSADRLESYDKAAGLLLGADDQCAKPFAPDALLSRLKRDMRPASEALTNRGELASRLTPSELRVLRLLAAGVHTKVIAVELSITPKTVSMHVQNTMKKLDVHTRTQAVALAHQLRLIDRSSDDLDLDLDRSAATRAGAAATSR